MSNTIESLEPYSQALAREVLAVFESWLTQRAVEIAVRGGVDVNPAKREVIDARAQSATHQLNDELCALLNTDVDVQRQNPLQVLRHAAVAMNDVLRSFGVVEPFRDEFERRSMPDDVFGIGPLTWRDLGDRVHDAGIEWGAWKAATILTRRRAEGKLD